MFDAKTSENTITRKMAIYWPTLLIMNGINVYPGRKNKGMVKRLAAVYPWLISACWTFIAASVSTTLACRPDASYEDKLEMLTYITGSSCTLILFVIGVYRRPALDAMLHLMRSEFWGDDGRRPAAHVLFLRFVRTYGAALPVANALMCMTPVLWMVGPGKIDSPASFIFRMWTPWTQITGARYAAAYAVQLVVSFAVLTNITGMVFAIVLVVNEMQVQMDMLMDAVRGLRVDGGASDRLVRCVKHHQTLIACFNNFKSYFNLLFIVDIVYILIETCLCLSSILLANGLSAFHIKMMSLLITVVLQFFFYCLIGEKFSLMNEEFGNCVYFKLVGCKDPKLSKMGVLIILRTQRPLQLSALGIVKYTASLSTFAVTMKSAYAGLNVLYNSS